MTEEGAKLPCRSNFWLSLILQRCGRLSYLGRDWFYLFGLALDVQKILGPVKNEESKIGHLTRLSN